MKKYSITLSANLRKFANSHSRSIKSTLQPLNKKGKKMLLHIPHSNTTIPSYEEQMAKDKDILEAIEKYTDHRTSELFHYDGAERVEYGYSRLFCDVEKLEENEPMGSIEFGDCLSLSANLRKFANSHSWWIKSTLQIF